jgi:steroid 5-alpha reductase family enzyme
MAALLIVAGLGAAVAVACRLLSWRTGDTSWTDRIWSIVPVVYVAVFAVAAGLRDTRLDVMTMLVLLWGVRLTANFARRGGYRGVEDYRWAVLRSRMSARASWWFDTLFIAGFQNALLVLIALPAFTALTAGTPFGAADAVLTVLFLALLAGETLADQQQWRFQEDKRRRTEAGDSSGPGFLGTGLWRWSRHPNYFFEVAQWWVIAGFGIAASRSVTWTVLGAVLLTALFAGSARFTESLTAAKYPGYADYRRRTSQIVPFPPRRGTAGEPLDES